MANIKINGTTYEDVPSIEVPNESGEMVEYVESDILRKALDRTITELHSNALSSIGNYGLMMATDLEVIKLPNLINIDNYGMRYCSALKHSFFPKLKAIRTFSLGNCTSLESLELPSIAYIGNSALYLCSNLMSICLSANSVCNLAHTNALTSTPIASGTGYIYVPSALIDSYKTATNWSVYANQFRALEDYTVDGTTTGELDESKI